MSETFGENMYAAELEDTPAGPQLISQTRVGVSNLGNMRRIEIDGAEVLVVDPKLVQRLEQRLRAMEVKVTDLQTLYSKSQTQNKRLSQQLDELTRRFNGITNFNE